MEHQLDHEQTINTISNGFKNLVSGSNSSSLF